MTLGLQVNLPHSMRARVEALAEDGQERPLNQLQGSLDAVQSAFLSLVRLLLYRPGCVAVEFVPVGCLAACPRLLRCCLRMACMAACDPVRRCCLFTPTAALSSPSSFWVSWVLRLQRSWSR